MADIMHVQAVDTGALKAIQWQQEQEYSAPLPETDAKIDRVQAHSSLNGIRIIASIFVVMNHVGFYPTSFLEKMARFNISIPIFFILAAFQLGLSVVGDIQWSTFVGTRIGNLHSLFIITQLIALPSLLIFKCAGDSTGSCDARFYATEVTTWFFSSLTVSGIDQHINFLYLCSDQPRTPSTSTNTAGNVWNLQYCKPPELVFNYDLSVHGHLSIPS